MITLRIFEKQVARLLKRPATRALQPVQKVARLHEVAGKQLKDIDFLSGETGGLGNLSSGHHVHGFQLAGGIKFILLH